VEVVEALGLSLNAVLLAKSHVLKRLRQELAGHCRLSTQARVGSRFGGIEEQHA
jgi:hypothetical protein